MDRFIVGTGRCGSTLLSRMMAEHPGALPVFEYFNGLDVTRRFEEKNTSGAAFATLISAEQPFLTAVLRRGYPVEEVLYPFAHGRYRRSDPLPWILVSLLPRLGKEPDALFDELIAYARALPPQPMRDHHRALFDWLVARFGRELWIERSGSSIDYVGALAEQFPDARFVHIHRDGREVALSIREHHAFRLPVTLMYDMPVGGGRRVSELGPLDLHAPPTGDDVLSKIIALRPPAPDFGRFWTDQVTRGAAALRKIPSERQLAVPFEDLIARPRHVLAEIAAFFELGPDPAWIDRAATLVRGAPPLRFDTLEGAEREGLLEACRPGLELLGRDPSIRC